MYSLKKDNIEIQINESPLEIRSIKFKGKEVCYQQDGGWKKNWPFLFPVIGRLKDDKITYAGQDYPMPRHGFFRDIDSFEVEDKSEGLVTFVAKSNQKFQHLYPFEFTIKNQIEIVGDEVIVSYEVINDDEKDMIFSMGHHPAFISRKDAVLTFEKEENFTQIHDDKGLYVSKPTYEFKFKEVKLADLSFAGSECYFTQDVNSSWVKYEDSEVAFEISMDDYNSFILWSNSNEENFLCIEPMGGIPDPSDRPNTNLEEKPRMQTIKPQESYSCDFKIKFLK
jgi:galactose mutarotase-like enzyme